MTTDPPIPGPGSGAEPPVPDHLGTGQVAAYLTGALQPGDRSRIETHLTECDVCCTELIEVARVFRTRPRPMRWFVPASAAAAAAILLFLVWSRPVTEPAGSSGYREPAVTTTVAPVAVTPRGVSAVVHQLAWTTVPGADRYRLTLFDATGTVVWETQTPDTVTLLPDSIHLRHGALYLWKVEAQTGWNRWVGSDLVQFSLGAPRP